MDRGTLAVGGDAGDLAAPAVGCHGHVGEPFAALDQVREHVRERRELGVFGGRGRQPVQVGDLALGREDHQAFRAAFPEFLVDGVLDRPHRGGVAVLFLKALAQCSPAELGGLGCVLRGTGEICVDRGEWPFTCVER
ncbi:hypothetical protein [Actinomadura barringtoniae]|uniref:hypothetical protein n=1 Tax=Actinomadura barringtoniae TaxID=1427535 RepID=UPI001FB5870D|nr:hypothetical protein [Actinomadura barringtoniae]